MWAWILKKEYTKLEEKLRKTVLQATQLDSEKLVYRYEVELRKEENDDLEEQLKHVEHKNKEQVSVSHALVSSVVGNFKRNYGL